MDSPQKCCATDAVKVATMDWRVFSGRSGKSRSQYLAACSKSCLPPARCLALSSSSQHADCACHCVSFVWSGSDQGVACHKIRAGNLQVDGGLLLRLVARVEQAQGGGLVVGVQALLLAGHVVVNVVTSARFAEVESESRSHTDFLFSDETTRFDFDSVSE
jgi:hypothetical protein